MENYQFFTLITMLAGGFGWVIHQINDVRKSISSMEIRLSIVETILAMMGMPIKAIKPKIEEQ